MESKVDKDKRRWRAKWTQIKEDGEQSRQRQEKTESKVDKDKKMESKVDKDKKRWRAKQTKTRKDGEQSGHR